MSPYLDSLSLTSEIGTEYFLASLIAVWLIEKVGRRKLMIFVRFLYHVARQHTNVPTVLGSDRANHYYGSARRTGEHR